MGCLAVDDPLEFSSTIMGGFQACPIDEGIRCIVENLVGLFMHRIIDDRTQGFAYHAEPQFEAGDFLLHIPEFPDGPPDCDIDIILRHAADLSREASRLKPGASNNDRQRQAEAASRAATEANPETGRDAGGGRTGDIR